MFSHKVISFLMALLAIVVTANAAPGYIGNAGTGFGGYGNGFGFAGYGGGFAGVGYSGSVGGGGFGGFGGFGGGHGGYGYGR